MNVRMFRAMPMPWTMFHADSRLHRMVLQRGVSFVDRPEDADIVIADRLEPLLPHRNTGRAFAVWTREPRYSTARRPVVESPGIPRPVHIMNCYTGVHHDAVGYVGRRGLERDAAIAAYREKPRRTAMLAGYSAQREFYRGDWNADLITYRGLVGTVFQAHGKCDLYGRNWPAHVPTKGESRSGNWAQAKEEALRSYDVNIAMESTYAPYYVTEKIWQAVQYGCLPIYWGHENGVYDLFPRDSFIEAYRRTPEELVDIVERMSAEERVERYALCVDALNRAVAQFIAPGRDERMVADTMAFLARIVASPA